MSMNHTDAKLRNPHLTWTNLEERQESDRGCDLSNDSADVFPNLFDALLFGFGIGRHIFVHVNVELPPFQRLVRF